MTTTMKLIAKQTLGANAASVTFSDIPGNMTDLLLVESSRSAVNGVVDGLDIWFNSDTTAGNYTRRRLLGNGAAASSDTQRLLLIPGATATASTFSNNEIYIPNYAGSANKSFSATSTQETNATTAYIAAGAGLWSNTSAITSIQLVSQNAANLVTNSSFFLYGITKS